MYLKFLRMDLHPDQNIMSYALVVVSLQQVSRVVIFCVVLHTGVKITLTMLCFFLGSHNSGNIIVFLYVMIVIYYFPPPVQVCEGPNISQPHSASLWVKR